MFNLKIFLSKPHCPISWSSTHTTRVTTKTPFLPSTSCFAYRPSWLKRENLWIHTTSDYPPPLPLTTVHHTKTPQRRSTKSHFPRLIDGTRCDANWFRLIGFASSVVSNLNAASNCILHIARVHSFSFVCFAFLPGLALGRESNQSEKMHLQSRVITNNTSNFSFIFPLFLFAPIFPPSCVPFFVLFTFSAVGLSSSWTISPTSSSNISGQRSWFVSSH